MGAARKNVSPWSFDQVGDVIMAQSSPQLASRITATQVVEIFRIVETATANLSALSSLFSLIGELTTNFAVVSPLSETGEKITSNLADDLVIAMDQINALLIGSKEGEG
jgi:hypothetical protein